MTAEFRNSPWRLAMMYITLFALGTGLLLAAIDAFTQQALRRETDAVIAAELEGLQEDYRAGGVRQLAATLNERSDSWGRMGAIYLLVDAMGHRIAGNLSAWPPTATTRAGWLEFGIQATEHRGPVDHPARARVVVLSAGQRLLVGTDVYDIRRFATRLRASMAWGVAVIVLFGALLGLYYSRRVAARVGQIAGICDDIMAGDLSRRLAISGAHDEFDQLGTSVNRMLERIEQQTGALRTTFDSTAHDLRAPLYRARMRLDEALLHTDLAAATRVVLQDTVEDIDRVQHTLGTLLEIARADAGGPAMLTERVSLGDLLRELAELYGPEAERRGIRLTVLCDDDTMVVGSRQLLAQLVVNLIENCLKYVPEPGTVTLSVRALGPVRRLTIADDGPGIASGDRERVLIPFVRLERDRARGITGSGLGLSLVAAVARLHGTRLHLEDNQPGLAVHCDFPAAPGVARSVEAVGA